MDSSTFLYDVPPAVFERLCAILDSGTGSLGWRGLAARIVSSVLEVRMLERTEAVGRSPTRELLWSWAQQNSRVQDLVEVLRDMGHYMALQLFQGHAQDQSSAIKEPPSPPSSPEPAGQTSAAKVEDTFEKGASSSSDALRPKNSAAAEIITFQDIIEGTRDFHHEMRIAEGHTFDVYRAQMGSKTCVVKLYKQINDASCEKLWDAFRTETEIHHLCHHPNILDLLCCFSEAGRHCLVYPYLPNGSLFHRLHHQEEERPLSWQERLAIIKGIAKALHHLYAAQPSPVICGNISSANILLDDGLQPKLSNFGLARLRPHSANRYCTTTVDTSSHSNPGYLPADFFRDGKLSFSVDVYSFGMIIMETVTGRKVGAKEDGAERTPLRELLVTEVEDGGGVDSCLRFLDVAAGQWPDAVALGLLDLALDCTVSHHRSRPSMETVILALSKLLPSPSCPSADEPRSLVDGSHVLQSPPSSIPVEHDEQLSLHSSQAQAGPCECSQSEVTYLSDNVDALAEDLYSSWPVQCSCPAETDGVACEDCRANGFTANHTGSPQTDFIGVEENPAKQRLRNKLDLYNGGLIGTEELFSETGLQ